MGAAATETDRATVLGASTSSLGPLRASCPACDGSAPAPAPALPGPKEKPAQNHLQALPALYSYLPDRRTDRQCGPRRRPASLAPRMRHRA